MCHFSLRIVQSLLVCGPLVWYLTMFRWKFISGFGLYFLITVGLPLWLVDISCIFSFWEYPTKHVLVSYGCCWLSRCSFPTKRLDVGGCLYGAVPERRLSHWGGDNIGGPVRGTCWWNQNHSWIVGGFHSHGGIPIAGWSSGTIPVKWMIWGYPHFRKSTVMAMAISCNCTMVRTSDFSGIIHPILWD